MSKKLLSLMLALALVLGALSCGFALADTEPAAPTATDKGNYTLQTVADKETAYADWLAQVMSQPNALKGMKPAIYAGVNAGGGMDGEPAGVYHTYCPNDNAKYLYDGQVAGINATVDNGTTTNKKVFWSTTQYPYLYIDLGATLPISQLLLTAARSGKEEATASVLPARLGDALYVPLTAILEGEGVLLITSADSVEQIEIGFAMGEHLYRLAFTENRDGDPTGLEVFCDDQPLPLQNRDIREINDLYYLPADSVTALTGLTFEQDAAAQMITVHLPAEE